jgi:hypothetical protein
MLVPPSQLARIKPLCPSIAHSPAVPTQASTKTIWVCALTARPALLTAIVVTTPRDAPAAPIQSLSPTTCARQHAPPANLAAQVYAFRAHPIVLHARVLPRANRAPLATFWMAAHAAPHVLRANSLVRACAIRVRLTVVHALAVVNVRHALAVTICIKARVWHLAQRRPLPATAFARLARPIAHRVPAARRAWRVSPTW